MKTLMIHDASDLMMLMLKGFEVNFSGVLKLSQKVLEGSNMTPPAQVTPIANLVDAQIKQTNHMNLLIRFAAYRETAIL